MRAGRRLGCKLVVARRHPTTWRGAAWSTSQAISGLTVCQRIGAVIRSLPRESLQPGVHSVATELNMSDHTSQRRLSNEGTPFSNVVEDTRLELVQHDFGDLRAPLLRRAKALS